MQGKGSGIPEEQQELGQGGVTRARLLSLAVIVASHRAVKVLTRGLKYLELSAQQEKTI